MEHGTQPVKRRQALQECNLPRNSWLQTHQNDETRGEAERGLAPNRKAEHRIDRFAHASKNSRRMATLAAIVRSGSGRCWMLRFRRRKQSGFTPLFEPITFSANVHRRGVMQQAIEDRGGDDRVAEDRTPLAIAFVGSQDNAASFITGADQLEENSGAQLIQWQIPHLIDDQHLRSQVDSQPAVQPALSIRASEVGDPGRAPS